MSSESADRINEQAGEWLARRDALDWSAADAAELERWLEASYRHRVAYLRLEYVWKQAQRLKALGAGLTPGEVPPPHQWRRSPFAEAPETPVEISPQKSAHSRKRGRGALAFGLAAAVLLLVAGAVLWYRAMPGLRYQTPVGAVETVSITDGSRVILNTDSEIRVSLTPKERNIELDRGEAFFEVAKDPHRPFVVRAGAASVTAVGTQFSVRRERQGTSVVVTEGTVRIEDSAVASDSEWQAVKAGEVARVSDAGILISDEAVQKAEERLSWRTGLLVFRDTRLAEAVAEFNRYNTRKIIIDDPALADFHVAGSFRATSAEAFVHLLEQAFPLKVEERDDQFVLVPERR